MHSSPGFNLKAAISALILSFFGLFVVLGISILITGLAHAADGVIEPGQIIDQIKALATVWSSLAAVGKVGSIILIAVSLMKVSFLRPLWDKLGAAKVFAPLVLSLVAGAIMVHPITLQNELMFLLSGGGAIILHELLDAAKAIPGIGPVWVSVIDVISKILGGKTSAELAAAKK